MVRSIPPSSSLLEQGSSINIDDDFSIVIEAISSFSKFILENYNSEFSEGEIKTLNTLCSDVITHFSLKQIRLVCKTISDPIKFFVLEVTNETNRAEDGKRILVTTQSTISFNRQEQKVLQISAQAFRALMAYLSETEKAPTRVESLIKWCLSPIKLCYRHPCSSVSVLTVSLVAIANATGFLWRIQEMEPPKRE